MMRSDQSARKVEPTGSRPGESAARRRCRKEAVMATRETRNAAARRDLWAVDVIIWALTTHGQDMKNV